MSNKKIDLDLSEFIGLEITNIDSHQFNFNHGVLELSCPWRVRDDSIFLNPDILDSKRSREEAKNIIKNHLIGKRIKSITIFENPCDIRILLENDTIIEVFPMHPLFESWNLRRYNGRHLIGMPGGEATWFLKDGER